MTQKQIEYFCKKNATLPIVVRGDGSVVSSDPAYQVAVEAAFLAFDPKQAQAEIEAEEKARAEKAAALETLADWMQRNPAEAVKLMEAPAKLAVIETKVAALETAAVKP